MSWSIWLLLLEAQRAPGCSSPTCAHARSKSQAHSRTQAVCSPAVGDNAAQAGRFQSSSLFCGRRNIDRFLTAGRHIGSAGLNGLKDFRPQLPDSDDETFSFSPCMTYICSERACGRYAFAGDYSNRVSNPFCFLKKMEERHVFCMGRMGRVLWRDS